MSSSHVSSQINNLKLMGKRIILRYLIPVTKVFIHSISRCITLFILKCTYCLCTVYIS